MGACATACFSSVGVAQQAVDVYVMAGQSNMDGRGLVKELAQSRPDLARPQPEIRYWYANPKLEDKGFSTGWIDLAPGYSIPPKYLRKKKTLPSHTFGAEVSFGPAMSQGAGERRVAVIKVSQGGTSLARDWNPERSEKYALYNTLIRTVEAGLAELRADGLEPTVRGVVWHQGESDGRRSTKTYVKHLKVFIQRLRTDLQSPNLPFVIGELYDNGHRDPVRTAQRQVAQEVPATAFVTSKGLKTSDNTHFTTPSVVEFGERYAQAMHKLLADEAGAPAPSRAE